MKRFLGMFLSLIIVFGMFSALPVSVSAASTSDLTFVLNDDGKTYSVTDCNETASGSLSIPSEYKGLSVTKIGDKAFASCENITAITIPASVTSIGSEVFYYCKGLTSITVNSSNTKFTSVDGVLFNKAKTKLVQYPCGNTKTSYTIPSTVKYIGDNAFAWSTKLQKVVSNESIISVGDYAFYGCGSLESITLSSTVTSIGSCAFSATYINKITIPEGVTVLEDGTFSDCYKLSSVTFHEGLISIGSYVFMSCYRLTSITLPSTLTTIGDQAFYGCTGFTSIKLPENVTHIGARAFDGCKMSSFDFPDSVKFIGENALTSCSNLTTVTIGSGVETIESSVFSRCDKLTSIKVSDQNNNFSSADGVLYNKARTVIIKYPSGKTNSTYIIPDSVTTISGGAFSDCQNFTSIIIPDGVTDVGGSAFSSCENLSSVTLGNGLQILNNGVFQNCKSLSTIVLPDGVTSIGDYAFYGCSNLSTINIKDNVNHVGRYAFMNTAYYSDKTNWENNALYLGNCLIEVDSATSGEYEIKSGTKTIGEYALSYCYEITSLKFPDTVKYICDNAFYCCEKLETVLIPADVVRIGTYAFSYCDALKTICYKGTKTQWNSIVIGDYNAPLNSANIYYESDCFHIASDWIVDEKSTVYKAGSKHKECTECGEILETAKIKQLKCSKPKLKTIANTSSGVKITWSKVSGADSYNVYRKVKGGAYSKIGTTKKTYFTDKKAKSGKKYYYIVKAVNEAGNTSASNALNKYYLADPTLKTPTSTKSGVSLKWNKIKGAEGYIIYRKTGNGSYTKLKTEKGISNLSYVDKSAKKGKKYTYKVKAYYGKTYSAYSNTKTIKDKY